MELTILASSSSGNCALLHCGTDAILIDAGISCRRICQGLSREGLKPEHLTAILITHEHADHISGLTNLLKRWAVPIYAPKTVGHHLQWRIPGIEQNLHTLFPGNIAQIGSVEVLPFHTPHDTPESVGYRFAWGGASLGFCTDLGCVTEEVFSALRGVDAAVLEANHDEALLRYGPYPYALKRRILSDSGHLSNEACGVLAADLAENGTRYIILGHLSKQNNTPDLARQAVAGALGNTGAALYVAAPDEPLKIQIDAARQREDCVHAACKATLRGQTEREIFSGGSSGV